MYISVLDYLTICDGSFVCLYVWAVVPRHLVKYQSECPCEVIF